MRTARWALALLLAGSAGCSDAGKIPKTTPVESAAQAEVTRASAAILWGGDDAVTVVTQNVYLGFDIAPILAAPTPTDVPLLVAAGWAQMIGNDFEARAGALAREIEKAGPELVALEEVGLFQRTFHDGSAPLEIDYLAIVEHALAARGLSYRVAAVQYDSDVTLPMFAGVGPDGAPQLDGVRMQDRDVILARRGIRTSHPTAARYAAALPVSVAGVSVEIVRGYASVVAEVRERAPFRFVATHLEEDLAPPVQSAQAAELLALLSAESRPILLAGDFNSAATGTDTPTYGLMKAAGFVDTWAVANPHDPGFSCCEPADLHQSGRRDQRIDYVFLKAVQRYERLDRDDVTAMLLGNTPRSRTREGLWPSDHAGLAVSCPLPKEGRSHF